MFSAIGNVPDWVKLLGTPALWSLFLICVLWFLLNVVLSKWLPEDYVKGFFERNPKKGFAILFPIILSPVIILGFMLFNLWFQLIEPNLDASRETKAYRENIENLTRQATEFKTQLASLTANSENLDRYVHDLERTLKVALTERPLLQVAEYESAPDQAHLNDPPYMLIWKDCPVGSFVSGAAARHNTVVPKEAGVSLTSILIHCSKLPL